ncbi:MAG: NAD(P)H-dependent oxidoreductase [bacterium]
MKTLIISYLPRIDVSNTKKVLDSFVVKIKGEVEYLDLLVEQPEFFSNKSITAYQKRNYMGMNLDLEENKSMARMDKMTQQFKSADLIVLAFPMHNFSMPAAVKAYFDSILLKGETWDLDASGYVGLLKGKKALVISSSGGQYSETLGTKGWDYVTSLTGTLLGFMGIDAEIVLAQGTSSHNHLDENLALAQDDVMAVANKWYS